MVTDIYLFIDSFIVDLSIYSVILSNLFHARLAASNTNTHVAKVQLYANQALHNRALITCKTLGVTWWKGTEFTGVLVAVASLYMIPLR